MNSMGNRDNKKKIMREIIKDAKMSQSLLSAMSLRYHLIMR